MRLPLAMGCRADATPCAHQCDGTLAPERPRSIYYICSGNISMKEVHVDTPTSLAKAVNKSKMFLSGPINWVWLVKAAALPGKSLHVALAIRHQCKLEKRNNISFCNTFLKDMNVNRDAKRRALAELETAGLITVHHETGKNPIVTFVESKSE